MTTEDTWGARRPNLVAKVVSQIVSVEVATGERKIVLEALGPAPVGVDDIVRTTGLETRAVRVILLELDLAGRLERHGGQRVSLVV